MPGVGESALRLPPGKAARGRSAIVLRFVAFEDLGVFHAAITAAGYHVRYHDVGSADVEGVDSIEPDLLIILGGPLGAYEDDRYPFLKTHLALLKDRFAADRPTLGVCLGAQLIARALGARVGPAPAKEIGWAPVILTDSGMNSPLRHLAGSPVLHWHGDNLELPDGCTRLASTEICPNQAFARGQTILGLQFHPEVQSDGFERWLIGHASELAQAGIEPADLRQQAGVHGAAAEQRGLQMISEWLAALTPSS